MKGSHSPGSGGRISGPVAPLVRALFDSSEVDFAPLAGCASAVHPSPTCTQRETPPVR